jgi:hypothetical protein
MLSINKEGDLQISSKWVETLALNQDKEKKKQLFFFSHIGSNKSNVEAFIKNIKYDNIFLKSHQNLSSFYEVSDRQKVHFSYCYDSLSLELLQNLKFMFLLSGHFTIYLNSSESKFFDENSIFIIQSLFFYVLSEMKITKIKKITIVFLTNQNNMVMTMNENKLIEIEKIWKKCLQINKINENIALNDFFNFSLYSINDPNYEILQKDIKIEKNLDNISYNSVCLQEIFNKKWLDSYSIPKNLLISIEDKILKEAISLYFSDSAFCEVLQFSQQILKKWGKVIYKGKTINNYGKIVSDFYGKYQ